MIVRVVVNVFIFRGDFEVIVIFVVLFWGFLSF